MTFWKVSATHDSVALTVSEVFSTCLHPGQHVRVPVPVCLSDFLAIDVISIFPCSFCLDYSRKGCATLHIFCGPLGLFFGDVSTYIFFLSFPVFKKSASTVAHAFNSSTYEAETGRSL